MLRDPAFFWRPNNTASRGRGGGKNRSAKKFRKNAHKCAIFLTVLSKIVGPMNVAIKSQESEFRRLILPVIRSSGQKKKSVAWSVNDNFVPQKCKLSVASEYQTNKCDVPQGFILGHLLFLLLYQGYLSLYYLLMTPTSFSQMLISQLQGLVHDNAHMWVLTVAVCF